MMRMAIKMAAALLGLAALAVCPAQAQAQNEQLDTTFLLIMMRWDDTDDVDLHVIDPEGNEFNFGSRSFPGVPGELTFDVRGGPGMEVFEADIARTGTYEVFFNLYDGDGAEAEGVVYSRQGRQTLGRATLSPEQPRVPVALVTLRSNGAVDVAFMGLNSPIDAVATDDSGDLEQAGDALRQE